MISIAVRNILRHKLKTFLIAFGIIIGTCAVSTVFSVGNSGSEKIDGLLSSLGFDGIMISSPQNSHSISTGKFSSADVDYIIGNFKNVKMAMPLIYKNAKYGNGAVTVSGYAVGFTDNTESLASSTLKYGETFTKADIMSASNYCLVDTEIAKRIFGRENIVGKKLTVSIGGSEKVLTVKGVISSDSPIGTIVRNYSTTNIYLPYTLINEMEGNSSYSSLVLSLSDNSENAKKTLLKEIANYKNVSGISVNDISVQGGQIRSIIDKLTLMVSGVAAISLIVSGAGIMSVMLSSVKERKKEIGIKLSVGATPQKIMNEFLLESVIISLCSGFIGIMLSIIAVSVIGAIIGINLSVSLVTAILGLLFCLIIGIIFSVYPANLAAKLNPIDCLRSE